MGEVIGNNKMNITKYGNGQFPVVLCNMKPDDEQIIKDAGYQRFSLNQALAARLLLLPKSARTANIRETVLSLMPRPAPVYLVEYEMLFDPHYEIDVLKLFYELARRQRLAVKWYGRIDAQLLIYAEPGYPEYRQYPISDYDIICIS